MYDAFSVWRTWGVGNPLPAIENETYTQVGAPGPTLNLVQSGRVCADCLMLLAACVIT